MRSPIQVDGPSHRMSKRHQWYSAATNSSLLTLLSMPPRKARSFCFLAAPCQVGMQSFVCLRRLFEFGLSYLLAVTLVQVWVPGCKETIWCQSQQGHKPSLPQQMVHRVPLDMAVELTRCVRKYGRLLSSFLSSAGQPRCPRPSYAWP